MNRSRGAEELVREVVGVPDTAEVRSEKVKSGVYRLQCEIDGAPRSFVGKRLDPDIARRNELVARRWLPAAGLGEIGPPLLAVAAEHDGSCVWHLYTDLGETGLDATDSGSPRVAHAVVAIARIHIAFAGHALIPECRLWGGDLGIYFYGASVRDAIGSLEALREQGPRLGRERTCLVERLLERLAQHASEQDARADALSRHGGPETLLHGDLWPMNVMVHPNGHDLHARLIDWDHAAVGPVAYDLSTFLTRFPVSDRMPILRRYEQEVGRVGWHLPPAAELNFLFETAELARVANRVIWPALAAYEEGADWAYAELEEVERWFEQLEPLLPLDALCAQS
jgi:hypothetical protein